MGRWPHLPIFHTGLGIWTQVSTLHGKCFFHWAISPFPVGFKKLLLRKEHPPSTHILSVLADMLKENKSVDFGMFSMYLACDWALSFKSFLIIPLGFLDLSFCLKATWFPHALRNYCFFFALFRNEGDANSRTVWPTYVVPAILPCSQRNCDVCGS